MGTVSNAKFQAARLEAAKLSRTAILLQPRHCNFRTASGATIPHDLPRASGGAP